MAPLMPPPLFGKSGEGGTGNPAFQERPYPRKLCFLKKHPVVHAQGLAKQRSVLLTNRTLSAFHLGDMRLGNTGHSGKRRLAQTFSFPGDFQTNPAFILKEFIRESLSPGNTSLAFLHISKSVKLHKSDLQLDITNCGLKFYFLKESKLTTFSSFGIMAPGKAPFQLR
ncbi:conserved hypothetical protein [delta proteobacterium NaphS2]|nr:conserved hypothetical protein [delta proteobacterium NaphS2]